MYIASERTRGRVDKIYGPCMICKKEIINAGLKAVHMKEEGVGNRTYTVEELRRLLKEEEEELREFSGGGKSGKSRVRKGSRDEEKEGRRRRD